MLLNDIVKRVNKLISNNSSYNLNFSKLEFYINSAVDYINESLQTDFQTPREYFDNNFVDELISYYKYYYGVVSEHPNLIEAFPDNAIYFLLSKNPNSKNGYYIKKNNMFELVESLAQIPVECISFSNKDINNYLDKYNYTLIPDKYIRQILVYYTAALYLEEEDELENQYAIYKSRAEQSLLEWQVLDFSVFDISESNRRFL